MRGGKGPTFSGRGSGRPTSLGPRDQGSHRCLILPSLDNNIARWNWLEAGLFLCVSPESHSTPEFSLTG